MSVCTITGNSDMYGLGIRIGFYMQWYGTILASWIAPSEVPGLRFSNSLFIFATFLALLIQTIKKTLRPIDTYITLLLTFGGYLYFVPVYIWRCLVCCRSQLDPTRHPRVHAGPVFSALNFLLLVSVSVFQLWFWYHDVNGPSMSVLDDGCTEFGFFFGKVALAAKGFVVANILLYFGLLLSCVAVLFMTLREWGVDDKNERISDVARTAMQQAYTAITLAVATIVIVATELTIEWNGISGVGDISSAGQTIPMIIGIGLVTRILYIKRLGDVDAKYRKKHGKKVTAGRKEFLTFAAPPEHRV